MVPMVRAAALERRGVPHGFTTRAGGISEAGLSTLNLGQKALEPPGTLSENWRRVAASLNPAWDADRVALLSQVHGATVVHASRPTGWAATLGEADAAVTTERGLILAVRVADCVPVLLWSPGGVAAVHSGWRGTAQGVVGAAVGALAELTGDDPAAMIAAVGPCISGDSYEVGDEVVAGLRGAALDDTAFLVPGFPRYHVDLARAVGAQLRRAGVGLVEDVSSCTVRDPRFYSHRRDGASTGRFAGVISREIA
jgi:YfiH family protein